MMTAPAHHSFAQPSRLALPSKAGYWAAGLLVLLLSTQVGATPLAVHEVQATSLAQRASVDGVVEAVRDSTLAAQVQGAVVLLAVKPGDVVKAGQELVRIDARAAAQNAAASAAQVDAAKAGLLAARREYERQQQLFEKRYISQAALDRSSAQWQAAQAQVQSLQAQAGAAMTQSGFFSVKAPYAGVVSEVPVALGDMALPGRALVRLHDPAAWRVTATVPHTVAPALAGAATLELELPALAAPRLSVPGTAAQVLPAVDAATHTAQVRITLPGAPPGIAPGMFARLWLPAQAGSRLAVPQSALVRRAEMTGLYVLDGEGRPLLRQVRVGRSEGGQVEILSGVRPGDKVATDPQAAARER